MDARNSRVTSNSKSATAITPARAGMTATAGTSTAPDATITGRPATERTSGTNRMPEIAGMLSTTVMRARAVTPARVTETATVQ